MLEWECCGLLLHWNPALPAGAASGSAPNWGVRGTSHWLSPAQGLEGRALLAGRGRDKGGGLTSQKLLGNAQEGIFSKVWAIILKKAPGPVYEVQAPFLSRGVGSLSPLYPTPHVSLVKVMRFPVCLHISHAPGERQVLEQPSPRPGSREEYSRHTIAFWVHTTLRSA